MNPVRLRFVVEYDGTGFSGWQIQPDKRTVQGELIRAFELATRQQVHLVGSGRTDAGVHARMQVAHVDLQEPVDDLSRIQRSVRGITGPEIAIRDLTPAPEGFHARYSARERRYRYRMTLEPHALARHMEWLLRGRVDLEAMQAAAPAFEGEYSGRSLCAAFAPNRDAVVKVRHARITHDGDMVYFDVAANRFVTQMVRIMVGTLVEIGQGRREIDSIKPMIALHDRTAAGPTAPPHGLCLEYVEY